MGQRLIYLLRHGEPAWPGQQKCYLGQLDLPLSERGIQQAHRLAAQLQSVACAAIYASDLQRTVETAKIIAAPHGLLPLLNKDLREINLGCWEGRSFTEVKTNYPQEYAARGADIINYRVPGGESFLDCRERASKVFHTIVAQTTGNIVIVSHAGVNRMIICSVLGLPLANLFKLEQAYGCLNILSYDGNEFKVKLLNFVPELYLKTDGKENNKR